MWHPKFCPTRFNPEKSFGLVAFYRAPMRQSLFRETGYACSQNTNVTPVI